MRDRDVTYLLDKRLAYVNLLAMTPSTNKAADVKQIYYGESLGDEAHIPREVLELFRFACDDDTRPSIYQRMLIQAVDAMTLVAVATNGHLLAKYTWRDLSLAGYLGSRGGSESAVLINALVAQDAARAVKSAKVVHAFTAGVDLCVGDVPLANFVLRDGGIRFPGWRQVVPPLPADGEDARGVPVIGMDLDYVCLMASYLKAVQGKKEKPIVDLCLPPTSGLMPMIWRRSLPDGKFECVLMPCRV